MTVDYYDCGNFLAGLRKVFEHQGGRVTLKLKSIFCMVLAAALLCGVFAVTGFAAGADPENIGVTVDSCETHTAAVLENDLYVWGKNDSGQFPKNNSAFSQEPIKVLSGVEDVSVARGRTLVLMENGSLYTYGCDPVTGVQQSTKVMDNVAQMSCSDSFALLVTKSGAVYAWGTNESGQLGTGDTTDHVSPVKIIESDVTKVAAGGNFGLALHSDGSVSGWGANEVLQIGYTGTGDDGVELSPVPVLTSGVKDIDAGNSYSCILKKDGTVWTCGSNELSQLGNGSLDTYMGLSQILSGIRSISAGGNHGFAIDDHGQCYSWGFGIDGQLGNNTRERTIQAAISQVGSFAKIFAGNGSTFAVDSTGALFAWGDNSELQLGQRNGAEAYSPVMILTAEREWAFGGEPSHDGIMPDGTPVTGSGSDSSDSEDEPVEVLPFVSGYPDGTFRPGAHTTRAEFVSMLVTALGEYDKEETYGTCTFTDVNSDDWFAHCVAYAQKTGLVKGYEDNTFHPNAYISRAEAAAMVASAIDVTGTATVSSFSDVTGWAVPHVEALAERKILAGDGNGKFRPNDKITRAEAATVVAHAIGFDADSEDVQTALKTAENPFSDVTADSWAYAYILRAAGLVG